MAFPTVASCLPAWSRAAIVTATMLCAFTHAYAANPQPVLNTVFPAGGQSGQVVEVIINGSALDGVTTLYCSEPSVQCEKLDGKRFRLSIPEDAQPGSYELAALTSHGISSTRPFIIGNRGEINEPTEGTNDTLDNATPIDTSTTINGRIDKGDQDCFRFAAREGQRIVIECRAHQIDSPLRAVLELFDSNGRRLEVNRGFFGIDPLIDFVVPADGKYIVRLFDLVYTGGGDFLYRLDIDSGPRVLFARPNVLRAGEATRVTLFGWNLAATSSEEPSSEKVTGGNLHAYESVVVSITPPADLSGSHASLRLTSNQMTTDGFAWHLPGSHAPILFGVSDSPVVLDHENNHSTNAAQPIPIPCDVSGQLIDGDEHDWFAVDVRRGEVVWIEALGERIASPVDLDVSVLDESGLQELARFRDQVRNAGGKRFPTSHHDPSGRWVAPRDGRFFILVRNLTGGLQPDPARVYRLRIRREEPELHLALVPRSDQPSSLNIPRGGRLVVDVLAQRSRGLLGSIRVHAVALPEGLEAADTWIGPGLDRAPLILTSSRAAEFAIGQLKLTGSASGDVSSEVKAGTVVRGGRPIGWSRLTDEVVAGLGKESPVTITANGHAIRPHHLYGDLKVRHSPGSIVDVEIQIDRTDPGHQADVTLTGIGIPRGLKNPTVTIPAGQNRGHISFYLPPSMPLGKYTIAVQATTTVPNGPPDKNGKQKTQTVTPVSNAVTIDVQPAAFILEIDPLAPKKIHRGQTIQVKYACRRVNGFISKIHTELYAEQKVIGIRGRGVTFVGQTETGTIQIVANDDAPLGRQPFLRLYGVGVVEDQAIYHGSQFLHLEIVE